MISRSLRNAFFGLLLGLAALASWLSSRPSAEPPRDAAELVTVQSSATAETTILNVEMTAYTSVAAQTDDTPNLTASGAVASPGTAAASRDLLPQLPYGSQLEVLSVSGEGCGGWVPETPLSVADTMNPRIKNHVDVWLESTDLALAWGRCQAEVRVLP